MWEVSSSIRNSTVILHSTTKRTIATSLGPQPQLVKCGRARSGCEMTRGNFEVEVLGIYGRRELCTHGSGARPVSDGPYQPVDAADVRRRVVFGARQDNEFAVRHCCVLWAALFDAGGVRDASKAPASRLATSRATSEQARSRRTDHKSNLLLSISRERSPT